MEFLIIIAVIVLFLLFSIGFFDGDKQQQREFEVKRKNDMLEYGRLQEEARLQEEERQVKKYRQENHDIQEDYIEELEDNSELLSEQDHQIYDKYEGLSAEEAYAQSESEDDYDENKLG